MSTDAPIIHPVPEGTNLVALGVQPGWFVRHGSCSIWFEVLCVFDDMLIAAARNPGRVTNMVSVGKSFTSIDEVARVPPENSDWLKLDRSNNYLPG